MFQYAKRQALLPPVLGIAAISGAIKLWLLDGRLEGFGSWSLTACWDIAGSAAMPAAIALFVFEKWAWRWPVIRRIMKVPRIEGTWVGTEVSDSFVPEANPSTDGGRRVVVKIEQSPSAIMYTAHNGATINRSIATAFADLDRNSVYSLVVTYRNVKAAGPPAQHTREHVGTCMLDLLSREPERRAWTLEGSYWTSKLRDPTDQKSRGTAGRLVLRFHDTRPMLFPPSDLAAQ